MQICKESIFPLDNEISRRENGCAVDVHAAWRDFNCGMAAILSRSPWFLGLTHKLQRSTITVFFLSEQFSAL